ncbi:bifunctional [glutamine synthetase] adenylyltransferase/[glutamine synthetase]-adenylyl-L-tyrosine phosphorylase [Salinibacterium sp. SYSU T00001]|uniref:bifunctional [glutamine synthetase] adenylyltransferase/[glutamine synthetase]-adenylyl-L-tyrosine phosphorylase n=1 Tax=Homoserinimonas sedimenticola TaxID=2986805 RepID=UPI0022362054|nr:bifunctional [glutamine synthetase] adenylyltransferase/[glutamine synthetase]-adenylyl-L-tyrosine phosphorylase [Salinibacterium sedimenticola]MCW4384521.1 bifunctional [glutamine synthetase] adenylyltransferase/[glutamine synthetase]-adenylyl-L-tyrosine phosphorylase [Salinibacterium sedimenticola]
MSRDQTSLTELARLGFARLSEAREMLTGMGATRAQELLPAFSQAADPDEALRLILELLRAAPDETKGLLDRPGGAERLIRVLGASTGLGEFLRRHPSELSVLDSPLPAPWAPIAYRDDLIAAVEGHTGEDGWNRLRIRYRRHLVALTAYDLGLDDALAGVSRVTAALADLAAAALEASLAVARTGVPFSPEEIAATRLAIIGMGKAGARELNYVSDVDVIFVVEGDSSIDTGRAIDVGTRLAVATMKGITDLASEPALWEVDANLRPEGKDGALVRTLESHVAYYERWAKSWEFQALLKARFLAGDGNLGARYEAAISPFVWRSSSRENFVEGVQKMRERVTEHIPADEVDIQLKLGPGGIRDIEFTIQLLQLVHGNADENVRQRDSLSALSALAEQGYIGRAEAAEFAHDYQFLRVLEHRLQLVRLTRTHLMPRDPEALRVLARGSGVASTAEGVVEQWNARKAAVRTLHEKLFYRPLLAAVAALPEGGLALSSSQAEARLAAIGFIDPRGALSHIAAMTSGVSRRAQIQRNLLPVMLQWFAEGADPDYGLLAFRRLSDELGESYWYLRMLRDSSGAAKRLTAVLSGSRYVGSLLEKLPESAAWLENDHELRPRPRALLQEEAAALLRRRPDATSAADALRAARRREVLRLALGAILGLITVDELGVALSDVNTMLLEGVLSAVRRDDDGIEFGIVAMGRYGGAELGFGSDADVMYVYRPTTAEPHDAQRRADSIVAEIVSLTEDLLLPFELDANLRPEGRNGPLTRSLDSYRSYYERWSLTWEAQALLRARCVAGDAALLEDFTTLADSVRYPTAISEADVREVKRIKARVESERLPQAADPTRHLKLGRGSLSDVEWFVQLIQLQHGHAHEDLRTASTLDALSAAAKHGYVDESEALVLREAWLLSSRIRSAITLWSGRTSDVVPVDRAQLDGIARLLEYPAGSASALEEDYLRTTRHARSVFERRFYGVTKSYEPSIG